MVDSSTAGRPIVDSAIDGFGIPHDTSLCYWKNTCKYIQLMSILPVKSCKYIERTALVASGLQLKAAHQILPASEPRRVSIQATMSITPASWTLEDAQQLSERYPYTFYKPSSVVVGMLTPGDQVKLIFLFESDDPNAPRAERMWVTIDSIEATTYVGKLDNEPRYIADLKIGERILFEAKHIIDTDRNDPVPNIVDKYAIRCFVTRRVLYDGEPVGYLYREEPDEEEDSGWRIMAGDESQAYMDDSDNIALGSLGAVLREDDSIVKLLDAPVGIAYALNRETGEFEVAGQDDG
jgi:hypothetical protein